MNYKYFYTFLFVFFVIMQGIFANNDWIITEESTDTFGNKSIQTTFIKDELIRHETLSSIALVDLKQKLITIIFSEYRVYWQGTTQDLKESNIAIYDKQMEEMLVGLPVSAQKELDSIYLEIRKQMLDSTEPKTNRQISINKTNDTLSILGYSTIKYDIKTDSSIVESVWHTKEIAPYRNIDVLDMMQFMKQLDPSPAKNNIANSPDYLNLLKTGLLLKSVNYSPAGENKVEVTKVREVTLPADFFKPPENYKETSFADILNLMPVIMETEDDTDKW